MVVHVARFFEMFDAIGNYRRAALVTVAVRYQKPTVDPSKLCTVQVSTLPYFSTPWPNLNCTFSIQLFLPALSILIVIPSSYFLHSLSPSFQSHTLLLPYYIVHSDGIIFCSSLNSFLLWGRNDNPTPSTAQRGTACQPKTSPYPSSFVLSFLNRNLQV